MNKLARGAFSRHFRGSLAVAIVAALSLVACRSVNTPAPDVSPRATVAPASEVTERSPAASVDNAVTETRCGEDRDACVSEALPVLERALPLVERSPDAARELLRTSRSPAARAWAAYLAHHAGDDATAEAMLAALASEGETSALVPAELTGPGARSLYLVREHAELLSGSTPDVVSLLPCAVFAWDPEAARSAFAPAHGSTRDTIIAPFKRRCVVEALDRSMTPVVRARIVAAQEAVNRALLREWPRPEDGTMWAAVEIMEQETLRDALLAVPLDPSVGSDAAVRDVVARLASEDPRSLARVGNYRRSAEGHVTAIANGICAVARMRGQSPTAGQCQRRAYTATLAAFTVWVGAMHGM